MEKRDSKGFTYRDHVEGLLKKRTTPERRAELEAEIALPEFPRELQYLWNDFFRIRNRMGHTERGYLPIGWPDIEAYSVLTGRRYAPWEVRVVEDLDDIWLAEANKVDDA